MLPLPVGSDASSGVGTPVYTRHRPGRTLLDQLVHEYYPAFKAQLAMQGAVMPADVEREFDHYLECGRLKLLHPSSPTCGAAQCRLGQTRLQ